MHIAFLTSEYPTEYPDGGGLGIYVHRISKSLIELGHQPEVFVTSKKPSGVIDYEGVRVHQINRLREHKVLEFFRRTSTKLIRLESWRYAAPWVLDAFSLARAMERRHSVVPFDLVQSADYLASGLLVRRLANRQHVVRCSTAADLYSDYDQPRSSVESCRAFLERLSMKRADIAYAPSQYIANHFRRVHRINVRVIRPPVYPELFLAVKTQSWRCQQDSFFISVNLTPAKARHCLQRRCPLRGDQLLISQWCGVGGGRRSN